MAFNPDEYLQKNKPQFDPDAYLAKDEKPKGTSGKSLQAGLEAYGNTALMGYLPHVQAALTPDPNKYLDEELRQKGFKISQPKMPSYTERRDENLKRLEQQAVENPTASKIGTALGVVGGALATAPFSGTAQGLSAAQRFKQAATVGGVMGALQNPGDVEGEIHPIQPESRLKNAGLGIGTGLVAQGLAEGVSKVGSGISSWLKGKSNEKAVAAIGANKADMKFLGPKGVDQLGQETLKKEIVTPLSTPKSILEKAENSKEVVGDQIGKIIRMADDAGAPKIDGAKIGLNLLDDAEIQAARTTPEMGSMVNAAERSAESLASNGEMTLKQAHDLRRRVDQSIKFNRKRGELPPGTQEVLYKVRDALNTAINDGVNESVGAGTDVLKKLNSEYSKLSKIQKIAENRVAMNSSNRAIGLTDTIAAAAGGAIGNEIGGPEGSVIGTLVGGALNKTGRTFGASVQATGFNRASKILAISPAVERFASQNPLAFQTIANRISDKMSGGGKFERIEDHPILRDKKLVEQFKSHPELIDSIQDDKLRKQMYKKIGRDPSGISVPSN